MHDLNQFRTRTVHYALIYLAFARTAAWYFGVQGQLLWILSLKMKAKYYFETSKHA